MKKFSELKGFTPVSKIIQIDSMTAALRNSLWNVLDLALWSTNGFVYNSRYEPAIEPFSRHLWHDYFKLPIDSRPDMAVDKLKFIRKYFFSCKWYEVYDFLEFIVSAYEKHKPRLAEHLNVVLE